MRVALLTYNAQQGDAIGNQVAEKLTFFLDRGADVRVFLESDKRLHPLVRPHVHRLRSPAPSGAAWEFMASADLVVVEYAQYYAALGLLPLLAEGRPRILFDYHGVTPPHLWEAHNREALEQGARQRGLVWCADSALVHSRFAGRELTSQTGFPTERLRVLAHPVPGAAGTPDQGRALRAELGLQNATVLLFVGRLAANKRVSLLVGALERLRDVGPPAHALVIGDDSDLYRVEVQRCKMLAAAAGLADRLHFLGHVPDERLAAAYAAADIFVMPSVHEGFCIPVVEAMAAGVPVVAARAGALPETVGDAGLTFTADDADDLARQVRALDRLQSGRSPGSAQRRVALVAVRYGDRLIGGAEQSLRTIARTLHRAGHHVEIFSTCTRAESDWVNTLPAGTRQVDGIPVHCFPIDPHDRERHHRSVRFILQAEGAVSATAEQEYLAHSVHSALLLEALRDRSEEFDAIITGPYLFGLTHDVARTFPDKTLLLPCFHNEPFARLSVWQAAYPHVGGMLYHSQEEQELAERELGLNHPRSVCLGTLLEVAAPGDGVAGKRSVGLNQPYVVYCGRYSQQKNLPLLLEWARRYHTAHPGRFAFVFMGQGEVAIPRETWARNLGVLDEQDKRAVLAGAAALVQLSRFEALSLAALEAWAQGVPVVASSACAVLAGNLQRSGGGRAVDDFAAFAAALDDLWQHPSRWQEMGTSGRDFVQREYSRPEAYLQCLEDALASLDRPLAQCMRERGLARATLFERCRWREQFGRLVEELVDSSPRLVLPRVEVRPRLTTRQAVAGQEAVLVPVRVANRGTQLIVDGGPARGQLRCLVVDEQGEPCDVCETFTPLPGLLLPGQEIAAAVRVPVPRAPGAYRVGLWLDSPPGKAPPAGELADRPSPEAWFGLQVESPALASGRSNFASLLAAAQAALAEAERRQQLPDDYTDITEGFLARWKRLIKRKLLGNFKQAYVDVLSRQQSAFNRQILTALGELAECCALLDHAQSRPPTADRKGEAGAEMKDRLQAEV